MNDCLIIGAGPAGLLAAVYLARFRRNAVVVDNAASRAAWIPISHNYPGAAEGLPGTAILQQLREQVEKYKVTIVNTTIQRLERADGDNFVATSSDQEFKACKVILATGVVDNEPHLPEIPNAVQRGYLRHCVICDGFEVMDKKVGVIGYSQHAVKEALFIRTYSKDVTLLTLGNSMQVEQDDYEQLRQANIQFIEEPITKAVIENDRISALCTSKALALHFDTIYSALSFYARSDLAKQLGAELEDCDCVATDAHQRTTVPGLYAIGDVTSGLSQMSTAFGHAAIAATHVHNSLPSNWRN